MMTYTAHIKQHSAIWNLWRGHHRLGGIIFGSHFAWQPGNIYRTGPLTNEQATLLGSHDCVQVEGAAEAPQQPTEARTPVAAVKSSAALREPPAPPAAEIGLVSPGSAAEAPAAASAPPVIDHLPLLDVEEEEVEPEIAVLVAEAEAMAVEVIEAAPAAAVKPPAPVRVRPLRR